MEARRPPLRRLAAGVGHLVVAIGVTWPLAAQGDRLPLGRERVATVPQFNLWTLRWTADRIPHGLSGWWDAPIFWPQRGAFAASEPQPLTGAAFAAIRWATGDVRGYAAIVILTVVLNGITAAALARRLGVGPEAAFATGVLAQALPFAFDQFGVLQLLAVWPLFAAAAALLAWIDEPRARHAVLFGLAMAASVLTCGYYALLFATCLALAVPVAVDRSWVADRQRRVAGVLMAVGTAALLTAPVVLGQQARLGGRRWRAETIAAGSASWSEWGPGGRLSPGLPLVLLAAAGLWLARRGPRARLLLAVLVVAVLASLGSNLSIGGWHPWPVLADHVGPIARLRSPFRAAAVAQVALVALAAPALQRLWDLPRASGRVLVPVVAALAVGAAGVGSGPSAEVSPPGAWAAALAERPDADPVVFLPFAPGPSAADFEPTTARMLEALDVGHPMLGGYSGFFPKDHAALRSALRGFPDRRSLALLRDRSVRYVVVDTATFDGFDRRLALRLGYRALAHDGDAWLLEVPRG